MNKILVIITSVLLGLMSMQVMAASPDRAWAVEGATQQPPPQPGVPDPMSDFITQGEWGPGFNAQNRMLDEYARKFKLQDQGWRKQKPWYKPSK